MPNSFFKEVQMNNTNPKNQHYVPRVYLKNFSIKIKKEYSLYVYKKDDNNIFKTNIKNIAAEKDFYTVNNKKDNEGKEIDPYKYENIYSSIESELNKTLQEINQKNNFLCNEKTLKLTDDNIDKISKFIIVQMLRGKLCRAYEKEYYNYEFEKFKNQFFSEFDSKFIKNFLNNFLNDENNFKLITGIINTDPSRINRIANILKAGCWVIYCIKGDKEFITSDNPVVFYDLSNKNDGLFADGILGESTMILFPLNNKMLLTVYCVNTLVNRVIRENYHKGIKYVYDDKDSNFIDLMNKIQINKCVNQVYSKNRKTLDELMNQ